MAKRTVKDTSPDSRLLEDRWLAFLVARGTQPMRWLTRRVAGLEVICKYSRHNRLKRIAGALLFPAFVCYEFLFRIFFGAQRLLILRLNRRHLGLEVDDGTLKFNGDIVNLDLNVCVQKALGYAGYLRERVVDGREANHSAIRVLPNTKAQAQPPERSVACNKDVRVSYGGQLPGGAAVA